MSFELSGGKLSEKVYLLLLILEDEDEVVLSTVITNDASDWVSRLFKAIILFSFFGVASLIVD